MSDEQINVAIAEACGKDRLFVLKKRGLYYRPNAAGYTDRVSEAWIISEEEADRHTYPHDDPVTKHRAPVPNYANDLNAMFSAEEWLASHGEGELGYQYDQKWLPQVVGAHEKELGLLNTWVMTHATARKRAEAFLLTIGKLDEKPDA